MNYEILVRICISQRFEIININQKTRFYYVEIGEQDKYKLYLRLKERYARRL